MIIEYLIIGLTIIYVAAVIIVYRKSKRINRRLSWKIGFF